MASEPLLSLLSELAHKLNAQVDARVNAADPYADRD